VISRSIRDRQIEDDDVRISCDPLHMFSRRMCGALLM
jgi:hypothetical protein